MGYFAYDMPYVFQTMKQYPADVLHHVSGIIMLYGCMRKVQEKSLLIGVETLESSTIFLNALWLLRESQHNMPKLKYFLSLMFLLSYTYARIFFFPRLVYRFVKQDRHKDDRRRYKYFLPLVYMLIGLHYWWYLGIIRKAPGIITGKE